MGNLTIWDPNIGNRPANLALANNFSATSDPGPSNDSSQGYEIGSQWVNVSTDSVFYCLSAAPGAAVWGQISQSGDSDSFQLVPQGNPVAHNTAAVLTAADLESGIITSAPSGGAINLQLPLASAMDASLPEAVANNAFDFSIINTDGTNAATVTTNTGWTTLVGAMAVAHSTSGRFRARKTAAAAWTLYRIS